MRLTLHALGWTLDWSLEPTAADDQATETSSLDGGTTASDRIDPGPTDRYLGFTNGREADDE